MGGFGSLEVKAIRLSTANPERFTTNEVDGKLRTDVNVRLLELEKVRLSAKMGLGTDGPLRSIILPFQTARYANPDTDILVGSTSKRNMMAVMMRWEDSQWHPRDDRDYQLSSSVSFGDDGSGQRPIRSFCGSNLWGRRTP